MAFKDYLAAGYPCLWVQTHEESRAISQLSQEAEGYSVFSWDLVGGLYDHLSGQARSMPDPLQPIQAVFTLPESSILFLKDYHKFITAIEVLRTIKNAIPILKATDRHLVIISPVIEIPIELEKDITILNFNLPTVSELLATAQRIVKENELSVEVDEHAVIAGKGLTLHEAENAMALSLVKEKTFSKHIIEEEKLQAIKKSGLMELYQPMLESELGGLEPLKQYIKNRKKGFENPNLPTPNGIIFAFPPFRNINGGYKKQ